MLVQVMLAQKQEQKYQVADGGEGAEAVDGHTEAALGELVADLVEHMGEHGFDRLAGYATALHDSSGKLFEILSGFHC